MWFCSVTKCPSSVVIIITLSYMHAATWCRWEHNKHVNARKSPLYSITVNEFQNANHSISVGRISKASRCNLPQKWGSYKPMSNFVTLPADDGGLLRQKSHSIIIRHELSNLVGDFPLSWQEVMGNLQTLLVRPLLFSSTIKLDAPGHWGCTDIWVDTASSKASKLRLPFIKEGTKSDTIEEFRVLQRH